jgi:DNA repair exonuclease SbcCD nuclease subunit
MGKKILFGPDLHCWPTTYEKDRSKQVVIPSRLQEWKDATAQIVRICEEDDSIIAAGFPGDFGLNSRLSPQAQLEVINFFQALDDIHVRVFSCVGNHDFVAPGKPCFGDVLNTYDSDWGISESDYRTISPGWQLILLPWMYYSDKQEMELYLKDILSYRMGQNPYGVKTIVMGHWAISGSVYANGFPSDNEATLDIDFLKSLDIDAVIMGHIHKPQVLCEKPWTVHTGTLLRGKS